MGKIPVTLITGFFGAGKTTLLKFLMQNPGGFKIAIIENEFGAENVDSAMLEEVIDNQIIQMSNGCLCCSIREDLSTALELLITRMRNGQIDFDHVVIEATGLADPGPIVQTFFADENIAHHYSLDSVVALVDAKHAPIHLGERKEISRQIGFADKLIISKADLVTLDEMDTLRNRLRRMNPQAPQIIAYFGDIGGANIFDLGGFDTDGKINVEINLSHSADVMDCDHIHDRDCEHLHHHQEDDDVKSIVFQSTKAIDLKKFMSFLDDMINCYGDNLLRYKGILHLLGSDRRMFFQGVHRLVGNEFGTKWSIDEIPENRMVFIGIELPRRAIFEGLEQCLM